MKLGKRVARRRHHNQRNFTQRFADQLWEFKRQRRENPQIATFFQNGLVRRPQSLYEQPQWSQWKLFCKRLRCCSDFARSEEHTSELQSLMRISYAVFCLKKKKESAHENT